MSIAAMTTVTIGDNVKIADLVTIQDTNYHRVAPGEQVVSAPITICRNAWLGRLSIISPGVTIGENSVVAAGAVVTRDVQPNTVVAGTPAKVVRTFLAPQGWIRE
ncbi:acyltransferase [Cryobacterium sp. CG_9.6]|uniref:acyltransferase n=1 Tax=Cryobacterium sp. CG_9.6 TaxID=2760710 RepID=UPI002473AE9B|nr:acyltransferase [Cryobacterium sp. CG_9.6]MDH6235383.1 acetyltransferase-like isoleucine patch superfamily enzyme [Cryobacterium sp. CG_9.6]